MANNRMWLIHRPSQVGIMLGKNLGLGWYGQPSKKKLDHFYDYTFEWCLSNAGDWEDFVLWKEHEGGWLYGEPMDNKLRKFIKDNDKEVETNLA